MTAPAAQPRDLPPAARHPGPDVVRALALFGVILMNYHGYLVIRGAPRRDGWLSEALDPWTGVFSTRFAATFVLVAGVGVTLLTRGACGDAARTRTLRWRLASRGVVLYAFGLGFDHIWPGAILPFYGAMFAVAAVLFTWRVRWLVLVGAGAALTGWGIAWWRLERELDGHSTTWLTDPGTRSMRGLLFDVAVNGTHPLLPWLAFFCAGMVIGRLLERPRLTTVPPAAVPLTTMLMIVGAALVVVAVAARIILWDGDDPRARVLFSLDPFDRGILHVLSALGVAVVAFAVIGAAATRWARTPAVRALGRAGQMSLSIYVFHALAFDLAINRLGLVETGSVHLALGGALVVWTVGVVGAVMWLRRHERGPLEQIYRSITR